MEPTRLSSWLELALWVAVMVPLPKYNFQSPQGCALTLVLPFFLALVAAKMATLRFARPLTLHNNNFKAKLREIYHAIGFPHKREQNHLAQLGKNPSSTFVEGTNKLINLLAYLESLLAQQKEHL